MITVSSLRRLSWSLAALGLAAAFVLPSALRAQDPSAVDGARIRGQLDSLRVALVRLNQEQMADIQRMTESRRDELNQLREALAQQSQAMLEVQRELTGALAELAAPFAAPAISPFIIGRRAVAGAQLTDLNPDLARYFNVDVGVLVIEVASGSAAEEAGLRSGDVIVQVNDEDVTTVEEVHWAVAEWDDTWSQLNEPQEPITLGIVRDGEPTEIELPS